MSDPASQLSLDPGRLLRLLELSARLNSTAEPAQILDYIIWTAADVLRCDAASVLLYDADDDRLRFAAATGSDPRVLARIPVPLHGSIAGTIFRERRSVRTETAAKDVGHFDEVGKTVQFETRSLLGVPMRIGDEVVGVLEALNKRDGPFTDEDDLVLSVLADQAAVAIRNLRQLEAVRAANVRLERAEEARSRFLSLASHELRTPLAVIAGYADILRDEVAAALDPAEAIIEAVHDMVSILDAMREIDQLHAGAGGVALCPATLTPLLRGAYGSVAAAVAEKEIRFRFVAPPDPVVVRAEPERLQRAFAQLLDNAVRFTPAGGSVTVRVVLHEGGVFVEVEDTGCGLAPDDIEMVFREFYQVEDPLTRSQEGLGVGLAIARGIVDLHGGRVWAQSRGVGEGATFSVWLPECDVPVPAEAPPPSPLPLQPATTMLGARPSAVAAAG
jgi:signal transduction histidine kinase